MNSILKVLRNSNKQIIKELERKLLEAEECKTKLRNIRKDDKLTFEVKLVSLWKSDGEQDVTITKTGSLPDIIKQAEDEFKQTNGRSDVQADYFVSAVFSNGTKIPLSKEYSEQLRGNITRT